MNHCDIIAMIIGVSVGLLFGVLITRKKANVYFIRFQGTAHRLQRVEGLPTFEDYELECTVKVDLSGKDIENYKFVFMKTAEKYANQRMRYTSDPGFQYSVSKILYICKI